MKLNKIKTPQLNQNGYHKNLLTKERIGTLFIYPIDFTPDDCLSCDGYSLLIEDFQELYSIIGTKFNQANDEVGTFRVPDYNVSKRFLQPGSGAGTTIEAGLPNITGGWNNVGAEPGYNYASGAIYGNNINGNFFYHANGRGGTVGGFYLNASRSSAIFGKSSTVQPSSQLVHLVIKYK